MAHKWEGKLNSQGQGLREQGRGARATHPCEGRRVLLMGAKCTQKPSSGPPYHGTIRCALKYSSSGAWGRGNLSLRSAWTTLSPREKDGEQEMGSRREEEEKEGRRREEQREDKGR